MRHFVQGRARVMEGRLCALVRGGGLHVRWWAAAGNNPRAGRAEPGWPIAHARGGGGTQPAGQLYCAASLLSAALRRR